ncbi:hypothetical protein PDL71_06705 [Lacibacter sp. MH-610]|uniref:hypothetical protein n=1 Tax=Lacibacter sp. MH-610 TaxID=3020883 RepID=UPI0038914A21
MNFYRVLYCSDYSKKKGEFGIVDINKSLNEYLLEDGLAFPDGLFDGVEFYLKGPAKKNLADFQMTYYPWRLISEKMFQVLKKYSSSNYFIFFCLKS